MIISPNNESLIVFVGPYVRRRVFVSLIMAFSAFLLIFYLTNFYLLNDCLIHSGGHF